MEITTGIAVQNGRTCADNHRAGHGNQPSGLSDNAAQGFETRICRPAGDGQNATVEGERVGVIPGEDRVQVLSSILALILVPVLVLILILLAELIPGWILSSPPNWSQNSSQGWPLS
jgi:hypothetical protein